MESIERLRKWITDHVDGWYMMRGELNGLFDAIEEDVEKLREKPSTVEWEVADETYDKYSPCEKCHELHGGKSPCASTAKDMTEECCAPIQANVVADCLRELGVDVD